MTERHGCWAKGKFFRDKSKVSAFLYCTACGKEAYWDTDFGQQEFEYCPYCGAHMIDEKWSDSDDD